MSGFVDVPDFWVRQEADAILLDMENSEPGALADSFERTSASYDGDPAMAVAIIAELRRRAAAGVRFWLGPLPVELAAMTTEGSVTGPVPIGELIDDEVPW